MIEGWIDEGMLAFDLIEYCAPDDQKKLRNLRNWFAPVQGVEVELLEPAKTVEETSQTSVHRL